MNKAELLGLLHRAMRAPFGILLSTNDSLRAKAQLYAVRKESGEADLAELQIRTSLFPDGQIVIVRARKSPSSQLGSLGLDDLS